MYTCESEALAALEMLVHLQSSQLLLEYSSIPVTFDAALIEEVDPASLPDDWQRYPAPVALQQLGDQWAAQGRSVVLEVPSIIVPRSSNFLLNPKHPDFRQVEIGTPVPFDFDARLK